MCFINLYMFLRSAAAFFKHDSQGSYVIQSARRFKLNNGVLSLDSSELDLYTDMCMRTQYLSHEELFDTGDDSVYNPNKSSSCVMKPPAIPSTLKPSEKPVALRIFGRKIFGEENIVEVNKFTRRTHKQEFRAENDIDLRGALKKELSKMLRHGDEDEVKRCDSAFNFKEGDSMC